MAGFDVAALKDCFTLGDVMKFEKSKRNEKILTSGIDQNSQKDCYTLGDIIKDFGKNEGIEDSEVVSNPGPLGGPGKVEIDGKLVDVIF